jgi:hypothetical protein
MFGHYPLFMQKLAGNRLPQFSIQESKLVSDLLYFVGINHYATLYVMEGVFYLYSPKRRIGNSLPVQLEKVLVADRAQTSSR